MLRKSQHKIMKNVFLEPCLKEFGICSREFVKGIYRSSRVAAPVRLRSDLIVGGLIVGGTSALHEGGAGLHGPCIPEIAAVVVISWSDPPHLGRCLC